MASRGERGPILSVFIADATRMGCGLMAATLQRSRYQLAVAGSSTDSDGFRSGIGNSSAGVDVALISARLQDGPFAGFNLARDIRRSYPSTRIIALLDSIERSAVVEAFRSGATGILSREEPFEIVCKCIHAVYQGQVWASSKAMQFALNALAQMGTDYDSPVAPKNCKGRAVLTKREEGVVQLVSEGFTNRDISRELRLSENTVRNYLFRIFNKVGTSNRLELALYVLNRKTKEGLEAQEVNDRRG
jgi:two-component system nitrate/nitrite response regulator NarL